MKVTLASRSASLSRDSATLARSRLHSSLACIDSMFWRVAPVRNSWIYTTNSSNWTTDGRRIRQRRWWIEAVIAVSFEDCQWYRPKTKAKKTTSTATKLIAHKIHFRVHHSVSPDSGLLLHTEWHTWSVGLCVCLSVCMTVGHVGDPVRTAKSMPLAADSGGSKEPCIRSGTRSPRRRGNVWGRRSGGPL